MKKAIVEKTSDWDFEETIEVPEEVYDFIRKLQKKYQHSLIIGGCGEELRIEIYDDYRE